MAPWHDRAGLARALANISRAVSIMIAAVALALPGAARAGDGENNEIRIIKREDGSVVGSFGHSGRNAGQFHWVHAMAIDAKGNVYTAEVDTGKRIQKFKLTSDALK
jgi:hypothetical protein